MKLERRNFIKSTLAAGAAIYAGRVMPVIAQSTLSEKVVLKNACDAHIHIMDTRFPPAKEGNPVPLGRAVQDYRQVQKKLATERVVIVQPKIYGTNNDCILDAIKQFSGQARGIAVVTPEISNDDLMKLHEGGIRGIRFSVWNAKDAVVSLDTLEPLATRIKDLGWHVQLHLHADQMVEHEQRLRRLPTQIVFDHMGRLPPEKGVKHPAFNLMRDLADKNRAWVKLSGPYLNTLTGPPYVDASNVASALIQAIPDKLVWGSDWPHTTEKQAIDDLTLKALFQDWAPKRETQEKILVTNAAELYGFTA